MKDFFNKICVWIYKNGLLILSILIPIILLIVKYFFLSFIQSIQDKFELEFYQVFILLGAILTTFWTNKRHNQTEDTIFLNKVNTIYFEVIKLLSDKEEKEQSIVKNLINAIQASIDSHYESSSEKVKNKMRFKILNFSNINLGGANLGDVNLKGANLSRANLKDVNLSHANLTYADFSNAKNMPEYLKEMLK